MIRVLVCNYFERTGSFDGIETTCIGTALSGIARKNSTDIEEMCFRILGYDNKKEFENKAAVIAGDKSVLGQLGVTNFKDAADKLKIGKLRKVKKAKSKVEVNGVIGLDFLVAEFYKRDLTNVVVTKDGFELLPFWLFSHVNVPLETVLGNQWVQRCFVRFKTAACEQPVVLNKTLYTNFTISQADRETINKEAMSLALHKGEGTGWFYKMPATDLIFLYENDVGAYLNLLEYATATKHTYAELLRTKFIEIPDFFELYENIQCVFYKFGPQIAYRKGNSWVFEKAFHFLSDTVKDLKEPLNVNDFSNGSMNFKTRGKVNAIHCF